MINRYTGKKNYTIEQVSKPLRSTGVLAAVLGSGADRILKLSSEGETLLELKINRASAIRKQDVEDAIKTLRTPVHDTEEKPLPPEEYHPSRPARTDISDEQPRLDPKDEAWMLRQGANKNLESWAGKKVRSDSGKEPGGRS